MLFDVVLSIKCTVGRSSRSGRLGMAPTSELRTSIPHRARFLPTGSPGAHLRPASISRHAIRTLPAHMHSLHQKDTSVLSLAGDSDHLFSGSQGQDIYVRRRRRVEWCMV